MNAARYGDTRTKLMSPIRPVATRELINEEGCKKMFIKIILLQTWKVASQQCESNGWEESFTDISIGSLAEATSGSPTLATILATLATKYGISKVLESSRYFY
ncbi:hypothetical protein AVEN_122592-1 [Araneus ventricosus]|uniref:Uncharacterized protein n=1 Tax=Araneus ventricosus TaxID=182803 RepID=A0A4Y2KLJ9_ARAVE|nr:hypothetical protein AVEN_122592-1 [Araneus ventricosus]